MLSVDFFANLVGGLLLLPRWFENKKAMALLPLGILAFATAVFYQNYGNADYFKISWISLPKLKLALNLSSSSALYPLLLPPVCFSAVFMLNNIFYKAEKQPLLQNVLLLFNLSALVLLACATNFMQLLLAVEIISLCSVCMVADAESKMSFIGLCTLADMALMTALAVIFAQFGSMNLEKALYYAEHLRYRGLVSSLILFSILAKSGLFLFHPGLFSLEDIRLNRLFSLLCVAAPWCVVFLFIKFFPFYAGFFNEISILCLISFVWGMAGFLINDSLKVKILYLFMAAASLIFYQQPLNAGGFIIHAFRILGVFYILSLVLWGINIAASNEIYLSKMGGFIKYIRFYFIISLLAVFAALQQLAVLPFPKDSFLYAVLACFALGMGHVLHQAYLSPVRADERVIALLKNPPFWFCVSLLALCGALLYFSQPLRPLGGVAFGAFLLLFALAPLRFLYSWADVDLMQNNRFFIKTYEMVAVMPLRVLGRVLWLTVDFIFIERTLFSSLRRLYGVLQALCGFLSKNSRIAYAVILFLGVVLYLYLAGGRL